ncbi:MAG TPA: DUF4143 domain-containing protein [Candidatus Lambdaproteobacteria bacterium]|nr:DUF4143 domain-containing protein [Candidatus Lambdaproteobacteria bacterium]HIO10553.1 DUF4143 domain-containing protein [Deltaproteobacteria bacterium]
MVSWLLGIQTHEQITTHPLRGNLFKTLVVSELVKSRMNQGKRPDLFYWRDSNGNEIDVIAEWEAKIKPIEIKSVKTLTVDSFSGLKKWMNLVKNAGESPTLIYGGEESYKQYRIQVTGWKKSVKF